MQITSMLQQEVTFTMNVTISADELYNVTAGNDFANSDSATIMRIDELLSNSNELLLIIVTIRC